MSAGCYENSDFFLYIPGCKMAGNSVNNAVLQREKSRKVEKYVVTTIDIPNRYV